MQELLGWLHEQDRPDSRSEEHVQDLAARGLAC